MHPGYSRGHQENHRLNVLRPLGHFQDLWSVQKQAKLGMASHKERGYKKRVVCNTHITNTHLPAVQSKQLG